LWRDLDVSTPVLVIFGGADQYISPSWYPTKAETGRVVPTWNYAVVHAHGRLRWIEEADRVHALVTALTDQHEAARPTPWKVTDAPLPYVNQMIAAIVGFEIEIDRLEGKFKASQNRNVTDRAGVREGLEATGRAAADVAELLRSPNS
jgi:transcriptional regulator